MRCFTRGSFWVFVCQSGELPVTGSGVIAEAGAPKLMSEGLTVEAPATGAARADAPMARAATGAAILRRNFMEWLPWVVLLPGTATSFFLGCTLAESWTRSQGYIVTAVPHVNGPPPKVQCFGGGMIGRIPESRYRSYGW